MKRSSQALGFAKGVGIILVFTVSYCHADILYVDNTIPLNSALTIERFSPNGNGSVFASVGDHGTPTGIAFDGSGNLITVQGFGIYKYSTAGAGSLYANNYSFYSGSGCAFDAAGNLYVAIPVTREIVKYTANGTASLFASTGNGSPFGLAFDGAGNLYAACLGNNTIEKFTPGGVRSDFASGGLLSAPIGLAFGGDGYLYVVNQGGGLVKFSPAGLGSIFGNGNLQIYSEGGMAFDSLGNLYVADYVNNAIFRFTPAGNKSVIASGGLLSGPRFLAFTDDNGVPLLWVPEPSTEVLSGVGFLFLLLKKRVP